MILESRSEEAEADAGLLEDGDAASTVGDSSSSSSVARRRRKAVAVATAKRCDVVLIEVSNRYYW